MLKWARRLAWIGGVWLILVVIGLVVAGERQLAGRNAAWIDIEASPGRVYEHLVEVPLLKRWANFATIDVSSGARLEDGSTLRVAIRRGSAEPVELEGAVTAADAPQRLALILRLGTEEEAGFTQLVQYRLEDAGSTTRVVATADAQYRGAALRLLEPLITLSAQRQLHENLARLKAVVEEPAPPPAS